MDNIFDFHLLRPYFLVLLLPLFFWKIIKIMASNKTNVWQKAIDTVLVPRLFEKQNAKKSTLNSYLVIIIWILLVMALCGPTWKEVPKAMYKNLAPTVFVLDASESMNAKDVAPSRLARSVLKIYDVLSLKRGGLFSLIVYSNEPYVIVPLSDDPRVIETYLPLISTSIMPAGGSRLDRAIELAKKELLKSGLNAGHIVVLTDSAAHSENYDNVIKATEDAADDGYIVSVFGAGRTDSSIVHEHNGEIYDLSLNENSLIDVVNAGYGRYHEISNDDTDINFIFAEIEKRLRERNPLIKTNLDSKMWEDEGILFLIPVLFLFPFLFRKGVIIVIVFSCVSFSFEAYAFDIREIFLSPEQYGKLLLEDGRAGEAEKYLLNNTQLRAVAMMQSGKTKLLADVLTDEQDFETLYNVGTMLAKKNEFVLSEAVLKKAVTLNPNSYDAKYNLAVVQKIIEKMKKNPGGDGKSSEGNNKSDNKDNSDRNKDNKGQKNSSQQQQQQQNRGAGFEENSDDVAELLKNKMYKIFLQRRYGAGGENLEW